jgi:teichoic acid transport system permease protein
MPYLLRTWMYGSAILYSVDMFARHLPGWAAAIVHANPILVYIELARYALMTNPPLASTFTELWIMGGAWAAVAAMFGFVYFWAGEPEYGRG